MKQYIQNDLTKELQTILDALLCCKPVDQVIVNCLKILNQLVPTNFQALLGKNEKMCFILILKCLDRLSTGISAN